MPGKKKKGSKKKKKTSASAKAAAEDVPEHKNLPPPFRDPILDAPVAKIQVLLANPNHGLLKGDVEMQVSMRLGSLQSFIKKMHGGSIDNIRICLARYVDDQAHTDPNLMLRDIGIATEGPFTVYYDYGVRPAPLLTSSLNYRVLENDQ